MMKFVNDGPLTGIGQLAETSPRSGFNLGLGKHLLGFGRRWPNAILWRLITGVFYGEVAKLGQRSIAGGRTVDLVNGLNEGGM